MLGILAKYRWIVEAAAAAFLVGLLLLWHHKAYEQGIAAVKAADAKVLAAAVAANTKKEAELQAKADAAHHEHDQELTDLRAYRASHPVHVRVCLDPRSSGAGVPEAPAPHAGNASAGSGSGNVLPVPAGNSAGRDLGPLLDALAAAADRLSATLREYQSR